MQNSWRVFGGKRALWLPLRHPHIVQIYDFDVQDDLYYMVMELLQGDTLKAYLNSLRVHGEHLPLGEMVRIFIDVLDGLSYAHGEGIIHRDLKPANIMLTKDGPGSADRFRHRPDRRRDTIHRLRRVDGHSELHGTRTGDWMVTCDARSDIYSLGIAYYEALTGSVPFDADTPLAILMKHINDPLPMPSKFDPNIPEPFERVALKALAKKADDRFQKAESMAENLTNAAKEAGILVPDKISLPQSNGSSSTRPGGVAVFSGKAREHIPDSGFAAGDTDVTTGRNLRQANGTTRKIKSKSLAIFSPPAGLTEVPRQNISRAVLMAVAGIATANMLMIWLSGIVGWKLFSHNLATGTGSGWDIADCADEFPAKCLAADPWWNRPWEWVPFILLCPERKLATVDFSLACWNHCWWQSQSLRPSYLLDEAQPASG